MLTTGQLRALMADHESDRVEMTVAVNDTDKFGEAICAFANDFPNRRQPGYLLVGVDDAGKASGMTVGDRLLRKLADLRANVNLEPPPVLTVQKQVLPGGEVAVVEVMPSDLPPVRYKGRVWIRVGPSRRGANQQEERLLAERRTALQRTFDARPCRGCNPVIAEAMATLGYVNAFGRGVIRAQEALRRNGNPAAEFRFEPSHVLVTIRSKP